ncbi:MAG: aldo/keto reductase [Treponema sp.]|jgi:predicted aldo/keto reductase-like oxidoreductase|nr:aldo/keto reductase [Treponema sp.]
MQYRIDKKSGNKLSVLGFGCMRFPKSMQKTDELVMRSIELGVNYFDTAWIYPGNEEALGTVIKKNNVREKIYIATKLPLVMVKKPEDFDKYFNQSLQRLKTDYIDYYLMHMIMDMDQWNKLKSMGIEDWIAQKKKSGQIKQIGFSFHGSGSEFLKIIEDYEWEFCMIQYNYSDENYQAGVNGLRAAAKKMPVMIMEPLLGGRLATGLPKDAVNAFKKANPDISPAGWAFNWIWNQNEVTLLLSGMNSMEQLEENFRYAEASGIGMLKDEHTAVYKAVLESINRTCKSLCTGCNYCMPCPVGVNIPGCFSSYNTLYSMGFVMGMKHFAMSTGLMSEKDSGPSQCINCGKCEPNCPQNIAIMNELAIVRKKMEPWWVKAAGSCARAFLGKKRKKRKK